MRAGDTGEGYKKSWRQETGPQITPTLFFVPTRRTGMVKKDKDRQPEVKIGEDEQERGGRRERRMRISYCSRHCLQDTRHCLLDTRQGRERQVQGPPLSLTHQEERESKNQASHLLIHIVI